MAGSVAAIVGLAGTGYLFHSLGASNTFWIAAALAALATGLPALLPKSRRAVEGILIP